MGAYLKKLGSRVEQQCASTMYELMSGGIDAQIASLVSKRRKEQQLSEIAWVGKESRLDNLKELERQLCSHKNCIGSKSTDTQPPAPGTRSQLRFESDCVDEIAEDSALERERQDIWNRVQENRKRFVTVKELGNLKGG